MKRPLSVLIVFNAGAKMYGMERVVVETFDLLRPEVTPHFLMSYTTKRLGLPILGEIKERKLDHSFFSDNTDWPRIGRPRSFLEFWWMIVSIVRGNRDVIKAARRKDVIYIPGVSYLFYAAIAMMFQRLLKRRTLYHFHDLPKGRSLRLKIAAPFITDFVHNSKFGYDAAIAINPFLKTKNNHIIACPVQVKSSGSKTPGETRNGERQVFFIGQVSPHKGLDILLDAFALLAKAHDDLTLNVVGGCDDPVLRRRLEQGAEQNDHKIKWWGYQEDVLQILHGAYLYVHPSPPSRFHESFGVGLVEAMSLGIPSVCFRSGALQEVMVHEETGLFCDDERPESLARSMDRLLTDVHFRNECGERARKRYQDYYSSAQIKSCWLKALEDKQ